MSYSGYKDPRTFYHVDKLYAWKHDQFFAPVTVEISPVNVCNQKCRYCYAHAKSENIPKNAMLDTALFVDIIKQCHDLSVGGLVFQGTGEPLMHKGITDAFCAAGRYGMPVYLTTNGVLLDRNMADTILPNTFAVRFSNFEPNGERYTFIHDCNRNHYKMVLGNMLYAVELKKRLNLDVTIISSLYVEPGTMHNIIPNLRALKDIGVDYVIVSEAIWTSETFAGRKPLSIESMRESEAELMDIIREAEELKDEKFDFTIKLAIRHHITGFIKQDWYENHCDGVKFYVPISSDGEVYPCWRFWGRKEYSYGNLYKAKLADILNSKEAETTYRYLNETPPEADECQVCGIVTLNDILGKMKNPTKWQNFL